MTNKIVSEGESRSEQNENWMAEQEIRDAARREPALQEAVAAIHARAGEVAAATRLKHQRDLAVSKLESKLKDLKIGFVGLLALAVLASGFAGMFVYGEQQKHQVSLTTVRGELADTRARLATGGRALAVVKARAEKLEGEVAQQRAKTAVALARAEAADEEAKRNEAAGIPKSPSGKPWAPTTGPTRPVTANCHPKDPLCGDLGV